MTLASRVRTPPINPASSQPTTAANKSATGTERPTDLGNAVDWKTDDAGNYIVTYDSGWTATQKPDGSIEYSRTNTVEETTKQRVQTDASHASEDRQRAAAGLYNTLSNRATGGNIDTLAEEAADHDMETAQKKGLADLAEARANVDPVQRAQQAAMAEAATKQRINQQGGAGQLAAAEANVQAGTLDHLSEYNTLQQQERDRAAQFRNEAANTEQAANYERLSGLENRQANMDANRRNFRVGYLSTDIRPDDKTETNTVTHEEVERMIQSGSPQFAALNLADLQLIMNKYSALPGADPVVAGAKKYYAPAESVNTQRQDVYNITSDQAERLAQLCISKPSLAQQLRSALVDAGVRTAAGTADHGVSQTTDLDKQRTAPYTKLSVDEGLTYTPEHAASAAAGKETGLQSTANMDTVLTGLEGDDYYRSRGYERKADANGLYWYNPKTMNRVNIMNSRL